MGSRNEIGPDTVEPISFELGGRPGPQTTRVLRGLTTKLAEARGGRLNAAPHGVIGPWCSAGELGNASQLDDTRKARSIQSSSVSPLMFKRCVRGTWLEC